MRRASSSPKSPPSLACGLSPATAIRGRAIPRARQASWAIWMTSSTRSGVTRAIASASATCVLTWTMRRFGPIRSMLTRSAPVRSVSSSVWPAILVAGQMHGRLVERRGDDRVDPPGQGQPDPALDRGIGEPATLGREHAGQDRLPLRCRLQRRPAPASPKPPSATSGISVPTPSCRHAARSAGQLRSPAASAGPPPGGGAAARMP